MGENNGKKNQGDKHCANITLGKANQTPINSQFYCGQGVCNGGRKKENSLGDGKPVDTPLLPGVLDCHTEGTG